MSGSPLRLQLVGGFRILSEPPIERLRTRKTELLLAFLALSPSTHRRIDLVDRFWPEDDENAARQKLRLALNSIRTAVGDRLEADRESVRLRDVVTDLPAHLDDVRSGAAPASLLPDHSDPWADGVRRRFLEDVAAVLRERAKGQDDPAGTETLYRLVEMETSDLEDHRNLLKRLRKAGRRAAHDRHLETMRELFGQIPRDLQPLVGETPEPPMPLPRDRFVGREWDLEQLATSLLGDEEPRLATLVGPPGVGKTRLSLELLRQAADAEVEPVFVPLADVADTAAMVARVAGAIGEGGVAGVEGLAELAQAAPPTLLVLDNLETIGAGAQPVVEALTRPGSSLRVLGTSQVPIGAAGEDVWHLEPLSETLGTRLFLARASMVARLEDDEETRDQVLAICRRLDGLPLSIELAASSLDVMPLLALRDATRTRGEALSASIERSLRLLEPPERAFLTTLAVFPAAFSAEAAGEEREFLTILRQRSLVAPARDEGPGRFRLLEPVRLHLRRDADLREAQERHARFFHGAAVQIYEIGSVPAEFRHDLANFEAAFDFLVNDGRAREAAEMARGLYIVAQRHGQYEATKRRMADLYSRLPEDELRYRGTVAALLGAIAFFDGDAEEAMRWSLVRQQALEGRGSDLEIARGHCNVGLAYSQLGRFEEALAEYERALGPMRRGSPRQAATILVNMATPLAVLGRYDEARAVLQEGLDICADQKDLASYAGLLCLGMAQIAVARGEPAEAIPWIERTLELYAPRPEALRVLEACAEAAWVYLFLDARANARRKVEALVPLMERMVHDRGWMLGLRAAAGLALAEGDLARAARLRGAFDRFARRVTELALPAITDRIERYLSPLAAWETDWRIGATLSRRELLDLMKRS